MLYFLGYLFLEVLISVNISSSIGGLLTFMEIILSAIVGISILMNFGKTFLASLQAVSYSCIDLEQFQRLNLFTLFGAIFLIIPGFFTDFIGIMLQFSVFTTMLVSRYNVSSNSCNSNYTNKQTKKDDDVIDVEIISDSPSIK
ncbi:MAG: FxsA family protein [Campylobacterota bacterium]|nr:FxsA family protein [Campylobacterota bacterium]